MIYFNKKPIARVVRRDMHLVRIIDGGRTTYHYDPVRGRARTMPGMKLTAVDDGVVLRFNSDTDSFSGVGDWPLQWSRGREWCDVEWNRTTLTMSHAGDCIWLRPKLDFFVPTHRQYIQANGRCSMEGYAQLFNPTGHCFPSKQNVITGSWPNLWRGDWYGELRIEGNLWAWNIDDIGHCWIDGLGLITSVIIPDDTDTSWSFCNYESMVNLTAPKLKWVPEIQGCTSLTEVWLPSATKPLDPGVFNNCTNLERVILPSLEEPQSGLFEGLSALAYIRVGMTSWPSFPLVDWVSGVAANGTFIKHAALPEIHDEAHIPTGWTVIIDTPAVSVTGTDWDARRTVTLSTQLPNAAIRYTMDGTE
ncbi:MAG: hypothetical protein J6W69_04350, partial [Bacteroidales bacterium]|nr:hypothetical protein [Bacteroidales bacterium]